MTSLLSVVNKVDHFEKYMADVYEFYNLGIGDPHPISAANRMGIGDMLDEVIAHFPDDVFAVRFDSSRIDQRERFIQPYDIRINAVSRNTRRIFYD